MGIEETGGELAATFDEFIAADVAEIEQQREAAFEDIRSVDAEDLYREVAASDYSSGEYTVVPLAFRDQDLIDFRDPSGVVLDYSTVYAMVEKEQWSNTSRTPEAKWQAVPLMINELYQRQEPTPVYLPSDTQARLRKRAEHGEMDWGEIAPIMDELEAATATLEINEQRMTSNRGNFPEASLNLARAAQEQVKGEPVIATYSNGYVEEDRGNSIKDFFPQLKATMPDRIVEALEMERGQYDRPALNRLDNMRDHLDWESGQAVGEDGGVPVAYQQAAPSDYPEPDALVLDHCTVKDMLVERTQYAATEGKAYDGSEIYALFDQVTAADDGEQLPVYVLDNQEAYLQPLMDDDHADAVATELQALADTVYIDETLEVPEEYSAQAEDYRIAASAQEQVDGTPLIVTNDGDYEQFDVPAVHAGKAKEVVAPGGADRNETGYSG